MNVMAVRFYDSVGGIAARYGLDGSGSNPGGGDIFLTVQTDPEAHTAYCTMDNW
jgi:hypothetical protein